MSMEKNRQSSYQCLRTTLVRYPDDIRGRRRANEARKILEYEVLGDEDFFHTLELTWDNFYDKYATFGKPMVKWIYSEIFAFLCVVRVLVTSALDVYSDVLVLEAIFTAYDLNNHVLRSLPSSDSDIALEYWL